MNYGLIEEKQIDPRDYCFGGITGIDGKVLQKDGQWGEFLPKIELQANRYFDPMACVSFGIANAIETLIDRKFKIKRDDSDRLLAKISGTSPRGNSVSRVCEKARKAGMVPEKYWEYDRDLIKTWEEFYREIPEDIVELGENFLEEYDLKWEWVWSNNAEDIKEALMYSPLTVSVFAWGTPDANGIYRRNTRRRNHIVLLYGYKDKQYWKIYDTYNNVYKKLAWNFNMGAKVKFDINLKNPMPQKFDNNTLFQLVEGKGGFGLYLDGKIIVDDLSNVLASWLVRNNGQTQNKVRAVTQDIWDEYPKMNLSKKAL